MEKGIIPLSDRVAALVKDVKISEGASAAILRRRAGMTLTAVAAVTGVHEHRLSEMERGIIEVGAAYKKFLLKKRPRKK